jgi:hypothetical protein
MDHTYLQYILKIKMDNIGWVCDLRLWASSCPSILKLHSKTSMLVGKLGRANKGDLESSIMCYVVHLARMKMECSVFRRAGDEFGEAIISDG